MKIIRWVLGSIILSLNFVFTPRSIRRSATDQARIDVETDRLKLYQFKACPFCVKVRRVMKRLNLPIETRETKFTGPYRSELIEMGGKAKVPCLRITKDDGKYEWMYESSKIISYLETRFN